MGLLKKRFKPGDQVCHIAGATDKYGIVKKDVSNSFSNVYLVKFEDGSETCCSEGLLVNASRKVSFKRN